MIEWMQNNRKWLVVTIWIATIAFIGAGFVGWGQFQLSRKESTIAKVKDTEVSIKDWQNAYNRLFNQVNQQLNGKLDEATAEKLGLKKEALKQALQNAMLIQFAKDLGLTVTQEDIAKEILAIFKTKENYFKFLEQNNLKPKTFEEELKKDILIQKLIKALAIEAPQTEIISTADALYNKDYLAIKIINKNDINVSVSQEELKKFWEENKDKFKTQTKYEIAFAFLPLNKEVNEEELKKFYEENKNRYKNEKGEILPFKEAKEQVKVDYLAKALKKEAYLKYKQLKNNTSLKGEILSLNNQYLPAEKMETLIKEKYLKPFVYKNQYVMAKLIKTIPPKPMSFEEAKPLLEKIVKEQKLQEALIQEAKKALKNFNGEIIGYVTKYDANKIKELSPLEATEFLFTLFESQKPKDFILIPQYNPQKAVVYNIIQQKLPTLKEIELYKDQIAVLVYKNVNDTLIRDLIKTLSAKYPIETYIKIN